MVNQKTSPQWLRILLLFIGRLTIAINALQALSFPKRRCIGRSPAQKIARSLDEQRGFSHWSRRGPTLHKLNSEKMFLSCLTQQTSLSITPLSNGKNGHCFTDSNLAQQLLAEYATWLISAFIVMPMKPLDQASCLTLGRGQCYIFLRFHYFTQYKEIKF